MLDAASDFSVAVDGNSKYLPVVVNSLAAEYFPVSMHPLL